MTRKLQTCQSALFQAQLGEILLARLFAESLFVRVAAVSMCSLPVLRYEKPRGQQLNWLANCCRSSLGADDHPLAIVSKCSVTLATPPNSASTTLLRECLSTVSRTDISCESANFRWTPFMGNQPRKRGLQSPSDGNLSIQVRFGVVRSTVGGLFEYGSVADLLERPTTAARSQTQRKSSPKVA